MVYNKIYCVNEPETFAKVMKVHKECIWASLSIFVNIFENTDQFIKIQTKYRPIFGIFSTDYCVITASTNDWFHTTSYSLSRFKALVLTLVYHHKTL